MDPLAPPVVAVVVTCDPGPWLEEALTAFGAQDYPNLSVLVIDAGSTVDPTRRVAGVLPGAFVRRLPTNPGFAEASNEALTVVEGASHFLFCHDDVAPDPGAVRLMVEEAFRSNAGVVCPKFVDWRDPGLLVQVGLTADKSGAPAPLVERGELDQEQHDSVVDVFWAPGGFTLVRADLFAVLGGFDPSMTLYGEDLDLSWRAQLAGARVIVAPEARVRHLEAGASGIRTELPPSSALPRPERGGPERLRRRHQLRAVLKNYSVWQLIIVLPQVALLALGELAVALANRRWDEARALTEAWTWNGRRMGDLRRARRQVRRIRTLRDREVRRLQVRGSARLRAFVRSQVSEGGYRDRRAARVAERGSLRQIALVWLVVLAVLALGSRQLFARLPAVGELQPLPSVGDLLGHYLSGWRATGVGSTAPAPPALALLGLAGAVLGGAVGLLRTVVVLGALPVGALGAYRLGCALPGLRARLALLVVYLAVPLPYDDLARGRWEGLVAYAAAPWVLAVLARESGLSGRSASSWRRVCVGLGIGLAVAGSLSPALIPATLVLAAGLAVGGVFAGARARRVSAVPARALAIAVGGSLIAGVLLFPWSLDFALPGGQLATLTGLPAAPVRALTLGQVLRMQIGPVGNTPLAWALLAAAALPLLVGRSRRWEWALRAWTAALLLFALVWLPARGWLPFQVGPPEVLLALAAACLAFSAALGLVSFEIDLPGYRFGWRQGASMIAAAAVVAITLPVLAAAAGGRWGMPRSDFNELLSWMADQRKAGDFRVLWVGDPRALPARGWRLADGVAYATSKSGVPDAEAIFPTADPGPASLVVDDMTIAERGDTTRLGHLLAPLAIRYVVVPLRDAPAGGGAARFDPPAVLTDALSAQVDLRQLDSDESVAVYENSAWGPARAVLSPDAAAASRGSGPIAANAAELAANPPVLPGRGGASSGSGPVPEGVIYQADAGASGWKLTVDGQSVTRRPAFGWASAYQVDRAGQGRLTYRTPLLRWLAVGLQLLLWLAAIGAAVSWRPAQRLQAELADGDEPAAAAVPGDDTMALT